MYTTQWKPLSSGVNTSNGPLRWCFVIPCFLLQINGGNPSGVTQPISTHCTVYPTFWTCALESWRSAEGSFLWASMTSEPGRRPSVDAGEDDNHENVSSILLQKVWQGKLPTKISLAANESKSFTNTAPLYVNHRLAIPLLIVASTSTNTLLAVFSWDSYRLFQEWVNWIEIWWRALPRSVVLLRGCSTEMVISF